MIFRPRNCSLVSKLTIVSQLLSAHQQLVQPGTVRFRSLLMNLFTKAVTRRSFFFVLYRLQSMIASTFGNFVPTFTKDLVMIGSLLGFVISANAFVSSPLQCSGSDGHNSSGFLRNSGLFHHVIFFVNSILLLPRDGKSTGFCSPGENLQDSRFVSSSISSVISRSLINEANAFETEFISRANIFAPNSSNLGIDYFLIGATLVFNATKVTSISPLL